MTLLTVVAILSGPTQAFAQKKSPRKPAPARTGTLQVKVTVDGAEIELDGAPVATSPMTAPLTLPVGTHALKVSKAGHAEFLDTVKIGTNQTTVVEVDLLPFAAVVSVTSQPPGGDVTIDGKLVGQTPLRVEVDPGPREVRVSTDGFHDGFRALAVQAGQTYAVDLKLIPLPSPPRPVSHSSPPIYKTWWFWTATGVVALGATALAIGAASAGDPLGNADRVIDIRF